jgi:hypothetical protein
MEGFEAADCSDGRFQLQELEKQIAELTKQAHSLLVQSTSGQDKVSQIKTGLLSVYSKFSEAEAFFNVATQRQYGHLVKIRGLSPEQAEQQRSMRHLIKVRFSVSPNIEIIIIIKRK